MRAHHLAIALLAALVGTSTAVGQTSAVPDSGVRVRYGPPSEPCREIRLVSEAGVPWVSLGINWARTEPTRGQYLDPASARVLLRCAKDRGLSTQLIISDAPAWASGRDASNDPPTPANIPAYSAFLADLAGKLSPLVDVWTIWNEPSFEFFWASPRDPAQYVQIRKAAYAAIKPLDPMSRVSAAAVVGTPTSSGTNAWEYLEEMFTAGIRGSADIYLWNFYPRTAPEGTAVDYRGRPAPWTLSSGSYMRQLVDKYDTGKPIWITETSYATCKSPCSGAANQVTEAVQADYVTRMFTYRRRYLLSDVERIFWYEAHDPTADLNDWYSNQGLFRFDWSPKPAVAALNALRVVSSTPSTPNTGGSPPTPPPTLPGSAAKPPAPANATGNQGVKVGLTKLRVTTKNGRITLTFRATVSKGTARLRIEGFRAKRWRAVKVVRLPGTAKVTLRFPDRGYLGVRVLLRPNGTAKWLASRVGRIPVAKARVAG